MTVLAHAEENQIEHRLSGDILRHQLFKLCFGLNRRLRWRQLPAYAMNLRIGQAEWLKKFSARHAIAALGIVRRYATLISPKEMHVLPRELKRGRLLDDFGEKPQCNATARQGDEVRSLCRRALGQFLQPKFRHFMRQLIRRGKFNDLKSVHSEGKLGFKRTCSKREGAPIEE